jgi:hypothetical protein
MMDGFDYGKSQKKIVFVDNDHRHAKLLIKLRHDGMRQSEFFRSIITGYIEGDERIQQYVYDASTQSKVRKLKSKKLFEKGKKSLKEHENLSETDVESLFDLIAEEHPEL